MKDSTNLRIRVPKSLLESLTREVLSEGKGDTFAMKATKKMLGGKKSSKASTPSQTESMEPAKETAPKKASPKKEAAKQPAISQEVKDKISSGELDIYDILAGKVEVPEADFKILQDMYDEIARDNSWHPDDDGDKIIGSMEDALVGDLEEGLAGSLADKVKALPSSALAKLKAFWDKELSPKNVAAGKIPSTKLPSNKALGEEAALDEGAIGDLINKLKQLPADALKKVLQGLRDLHPKHYAPGGKFEKDAATLPSNLEEKS